MRNYRQKLNKCNYNNYNELHICKFIESATNALYDYFIASLSALL